MKRKPVVAPLVAAIITMCVSSARAADTCAPRVGEIRAFAVSRSNTEAINDLHQAGWIEARGQLMSVGRFPELYRAIGRDWTATKVSSESFAVPVVRDERFAQSVATTQAYRALGGPEEVVTGGRKIKTSSRLYPISYWIFTGRTVMSADAGFRESR
jgi:hypothetical protein